ncbi:TlpA family protein disulfide reductase [Hymenobacter sp. DH14]|uniref:TlpA family protein disulfide reductase n=1 Tax=Hymenobacter cyanobacteriorum TaxID=2926463 RepID=A0A9X1VJA2_9BACT|nr:TlpA disulfide reductase family protein [Hymenobacter cyanobacteriorum]MCI1189901.1 TlpA family protein disulfide reductase [Hymenobacter cyanobacteriorum]
MKNLILLGIFNYCIIVSAFAQTQRSGTVSVAKNTGTQTVQSPSKISLHGEIMGKSVPDDSIFFVTGGINRKYYDSPIPPARITANSFNVETNISYPQMRRILLKSDRGKRTYRRGEYFIDASTSSIAVDYVVEECNLGNGTNDIEYRTKFIPSFYPANAAIDCHERSFDELAWDKALKFDSTLHKYVKANPTSYVALWSLIERFSKFGHTQLREKILTSFSKSIQSTRLWQTLNDDMKKALIKQGAVFPQISVKGASQPEHLLVLPKVQYTLVDFWFCRCKPCIESFPALKKLYAAYQGKGFELVSISTDRTQEVPLWQKRIIEFELPWPQYLDENAVAASKLDIYSYPSTFLLDHNGKVLMKDVTPEFLEKFLADKLMK